jgi:hypothetical protein
MDGRCGQAQVGADPLDLGAVTRLGHGAQDGHGARDRTGIRRLASDPGSRA